MIKANLNHQINYFHLFNIKYAINEIEQIVNEENFFIIKIC